MANTSDHAELTAKNRAIITEFADLFFRQRRFKDCFERFVREDYIQHNPLAADGRAAAIEFLSGAFEGRPDHQFRVQRIMVDGDMAVIHIHSTNDAADRGRAVVDLFRLEDGLIVEHWDVIQAVPEHTRNSGMF